MNQGIFTISCDFNYCGCILKKCIGIFRERRGGEEEEEKERNKKKWCRRREVLE